MILLTEVMDLDELNRIRILFESNGIPIFVGNEDAGRNLGMILPARKYGIFVLYEEQLFEAQRLLEDERYIVENQVDMEEHRKHMEQLKPNADDQVFNGVLMAGVIVLVIFIGFAWLISAAG